MEAEMGKLTMNYFPYHVWLPEGTQHFAKDQSLASVAWHLLAFPQESRAMTKKMYKESWAPVDGGSQRRNSRDGIKVSKKGILAITPRIPFQANEFVLAKKFCIWLSHVKRHQDGVLRWWSLRFSCDTHGPNIFGSDQKCRTPRGCFQQTPRKHEGSIRAKRKLGSSDFEVYI